MKLPLQLAILIALAIPFSPPASAQDEGDDPGDPGPATTAVGPGKRAPRFPTSVTVPVRGVGKDATPKLLADLRSLEHTVFGCDDCGSRSRHPGECKRCGEQLEERGKSAAIAQVTISVDRRYLSVSLHPRHWASLVELDGVLAGVGARIAREEFSLPAYSRLSIAGVAPAAGRKVRAALLDEPLFDSVTVVPDRSGELLWVLPVAASPRTLKVLDSALAKRIEGCQIVDAQWIAPCEQCAKRGAIQKSCLTCWQRPE